MPPRRPPDTRDLATRGQRALASANASRYDLANRVFNAALPYFGSNAKMPLVYWQARTPGGEINVPPRYAAEAIARFEPGASGLGMVAFPTGRAWHRPQPPWRADPDWQRQSLIDVLLHELAHTQQREDVFSNDPRVSGSPHLRIEGGADAFAALARDAVARRMGQSRAPTPFSGGYGMLGSQFIDRFGGDQALYGQFGRSAPPGASPSVGRPPVPGVTGPGIRGLPPWAYRG